MKIPVLRPSHNEVLTYFDGNLIVGTDAQARSRMDAETLAKQFAGMYLGSMALKAIGPVGDRELGQAYALLAPHDVTIRHERFITKAEDIDAYLAIDDPRLHRDVALVSRALAKYRAALEIKH